MPDPNAVNPINQPPASPADPKPQTPKVDLSKVPNASQTAPGTDKPLPTHPPAPTATSAPPKPAVELKQPDPSTGAGPQQRPAADASAKPPQEQAKNVGTIVPQHDNVQLPPPPPNAPPNVGSPSLPPSGTVGLPGGHNALAGPTPVVQFPRGHEMSIETVTDTSQVYPYIVVCACGWQGRCNNTTQGEAMIENHLNAQKLLPGIPIDHPIMYENARR